MQQTIMSHMEAEVAMRDAKIVARMAWPAGKVVYYDVENDGTPDELENYDALMRELRKAPLTFIEKSMLLYEGFKKYISVRIDDAVHPDLYITQEDSLALDWYIVE